MFWVLISSTTVSTSNQDLQYMFYGEITKKKIYSGIITKDSSLTVKGVYLMRILGYFFLVLHKYVCCG